MSNTLPLPPRRTGRPSLYSPALAAKITARLAGGLSLRRLCRQDDMPALTTVMRWVGENAAFREQYVRALEARGCGYGEQVVDVAQRVMAGELPPDAARVGIDGLKWAAARMAPRVYGDRVALTGADGGPLQIQAVRFAEIVSAPAVAALTHDTGPERVEHGQVIDNVEDEGK